MDKNVHDFLKKITIIYNTQELKLSFCFRCSFIEFLRKQEGSFFKHNCNGVRNTSQSCNLTPLAKMNESLWKKYTFIEFTNYLNLLLTGHLGQHHIPISTISLIILFYKKRGYSYDKNRKSPLFIPSPSIQLQKEEIKEEIRGKYGNYDTVIITATQHELQAVLLQFDKYTQLDLSKNDSGPYYLGTLKKENKELNIIITRAPFMGGYAATCLTTKVLINFAPKYLFMIGIAAGVKGQTKIGDILVASNSLDYNRVVEIERNGKTIDKKTMPLTTTIDGEIKIKLELFKDSGILDTIHYDYPDKKLFHEKLKCHIGLLATGSGLLRSDLTMDEIKTKLQGLIGIDMETAGVYYAARNSFVINKPIFVSIKSVSDFGGKSSKKKELPSTTRQGYALYTSARFIKEYLLSNHH